MTRRRLTKADNAAIPNSPWSQETGDTGLRGAVPREGWIYQEFLAKLRGQQGRRVYREMADNDPMVGAVLQAHEMLIKSIQWFWVPAEESNEARVVKDAFEEMFNRRMDTSFGDVIEEALQMLVFGFMPLEIVLRPLVLDSMGGDTHIGIRKLEPRSRRRSGVGISTPAAV